MLGPMAGRESVFHVGAVLLAALLCVGCGAPEEILDVPYDTRYEATVLDLYLPDGDDAARPSQGEAQSGQ